VCVAVVVLGARRPCEGDARRRIRDRHARTPARQQVTQAGADPRLPGAAVGDPLAGGIGNLDIPEPPAGVSLARPPRPKHDYRNTHKIAGASRFAGQTLQLRLSIDEHGRVTDVKLEKSSGYPALDNVVLANIAKSRFSPARSQGKPVPYEQVYVFKFQLRDANKRAYDECKKAGKLQ